jgi:adenosine deaminase
MLVKKKIVFAAVALFGLGTAALAAQGPGRPAGSPTPEQRTARRFAALRGSPPELLAFLLRMPKGGDLHTHLSGAVYAESYVQWAAASGLCIEQPGLALSSPPCDPDTGRLPASAALTDGLLYRQLIDGWSMRNWQLSGQSGHDHFFDAFAKLGAVTRGHSGPMLAELVARAARGRVLYVEVLLTPDGGAASQIGQEVGWDGDFAGTLAKLKEAGIEQAAARAIELLQSMEGEKDQLLHCGTPEADPGCAVTVRYVAQVSRGAALGQVYAQMVVGLELARDPRSKVVAVNLVQAEDSLSSMQNFAVEMQMLHYLRPLYPGAHVTLHAGELAPGLVPPLGLLSHVRDSVEIGGAERIGHGVDVLHETAPYDLLREMARRRVLVEICLSSNDLILGVRGKDHPLATYLRHGVPVALATDDEGVARSEISREYLKAALDQGLGYRELKAMARASLEHAFVAGASLFRDARRAAPVPACARDGYGRKEPSAGCRRFLAGSEKARLQWELEAELREFESADP